MGHARAVKLLSLLMSATSPWRLAAQCPDGSPPPCSRAVSRAPAPNSVAVLYLDNLSRDTADAYLADGLTEEIIIRLGQIHRIEVKSRFEVQRFRGRSALDPQVLGRSLNAAYLMTGSVQRAGARVRLRVALVRASTRAQVWGDVIDHASSDLLTMESDIARQLATSITGTLLPEERTRLARTVTADPVAYDEYLRGIALVDSAFEERPLREALTHFGRAIARDSGFAAAYAGAASAWVSLADAFVPPLDGYRRARDAANQAIARDSSLAIAYAVLANAILALDLDAPEAERVARRAVALNPNDGWSHGNLSAVLLAGGRIAESIEEARRGWEADSLNAWLDTWYAQALVYGRQLERAEALLPRWRAFMAKRDVDQIEGMLRYARGDWQAAERLLDWRYYGGWFAGVYVRALLARGDTTGARATIDSMLAARATGYYNPLALARAYAALGDVDRGMEWLRRAFEERTLWVPLYLRLDDELAPLRADPRYTALDSQLRY